MRLDRHSPGNVRKLSSFFFRITLKLVSCESLYPLLKFNYALHTLHQVYDNVGLAKDEEA